MVRRLFIALVLICASPLAQAKDIVETAVEAGTFNTLLLAARNTGLIETLESAGPWTIFAPTDDAFVQLLVEELRDLLKPQNLEKLEAVIRHHIVAGEVTSRDILGKRLKAITVDGGTLLIDATKNVTVGGARVVKADVIADNGFIHVIDAVIMPD
jgi:uncharacterized surface protein with fasciclin (FAS1) repeats